jgi:hypothetical protein
MGAATVGSRARRRIRFMSVAVRVFLVAAFFVSACATAPRPTAEAKRIEANPRAIVEGRVCDAAGHPVAGIGVRGIPWGRDIPWSPAVETDAAGRFRLSLAAPGSYGFLLIRDGRTVITPDERDPSRLSIPVEPGQSRGGVDLVFLGSEWERAMEPEAPKTSSLR